MQLILSIIISFSTILLFSFIDLDEVIKAIINLITASFFFYELSLNVDSYNFSLGFLYLSLIFLMLVPLYILWGYINKLLNKDKDKKSE